MLTADTTGHQDIPTAIRWIVERCCSRYAEQKSHAVRIVFGKNTVEEQECSMDENIVTVSKSGITYWYRPYSEPGAPRFAGTKLNGLFDFMRVVIWPQVVGEWSFDRLMLESHLDETELVAIQRYKSLESEEKRINSEDIKNLLKDHSHLWRLYSAIAGRNVREIQHAAEGCTEELAEIGTEHIQGLVNAIEEGNHDGAESLGTFLVFRMLLIAVESMPFEVRFSWRSREYYEKFTQKYEQYKCLTALAKKRYAMRFKDFCLSDEVLNINDRFFADQDPLGREAYSMQIASFIEKKLASPEFSV